MRQSSILSFITKISISLNTIVRLIQCRYTFSCYCCCLDVSNITIFCATNIMDQNNDELSSMTNAVSVLPSTNQVHFAIVAMLASKTHKEDHFGSKSTASLEAEMQSGRKVHLTMQKISGDETFESLFERLTLRFTTPAHSGNCTCVQGTGVHVLVCKEFPMLQGFSMMMSVSTPSIIFILTIAQASSAQIADAKNALVHLMKSSSMKKSSSLNPFDN